jgi:uncharacterized protein DUF4214
MPSLKGGSSNTPIGSIPNYRFASRIAFLKWLAVSTPMSMPTWPTFVNSREEKMANSRRLDILGNGNCPSDREIFTAILKRWRQRLGYCSIFAAVPAILVAHAEGARSDEVKKPEASLAGQIARRLEKLDISSNAALLKRQSEFRLPHQAGSLNMVPAPSGIDDCPGGAIPSGNYTAAAPYTESGNTTGANNTVSAVASFYYYFNYAADGPDHVYSFTLTGRGPNPRIEVSTTSGTYKPLIYVLQGEFDRACPGGIGNVAENQLVIVDSRWGQGSTATFTSDYVNYFPLNVPLYLFIDSGLNDAKGFGPYTIRMQDVTIGPATTCANPNSIDCPEFFVRQHYLDFFGREPDTTGLQGWINTLANCPNGGYGEFDNPQCDRVHVSAGFYQSEEFQGRGFWAYRFYEVAFNRRPTYIEFVPDMLRVGGAQSPQSEITSKAAYTDDFVQRTEFINRHGGTANAAYVNALEANAEITLGNKQALIDALNARTKTPAQVLREIVESKAVFDRFFNRGFVSMQYFGYLRRDPDPIGFQNWVNALDSNPNNFRHMIFGFIYSTEYRTRFGTP